MIVTCPACQTRYLVDDEAVGAAGRRLRCASCSHVWHYLPEAAAAHEEAPPREEAATALETAAALTAAPSIEASSAARPVAEPLRAEPRVDAPLTAGPTALPRPSIAVDLPAVPRRSRAWLGGLAAAVFVVAIGAAAGLAILGRDQIIAMWPATRPIYAALRLAEPPGTGLEVTVTPTRTSDSLVINGDIVNGAAVARRIPRLRITLRDGNKTDLVSKVIDPPVARLPPGATAHFNTVFEHPSIAATGVAVSFAAD